MEPAEAHDETESLFERGQALIRESRALLADMDERLSNDNNSSREATN
jgi:hypothetical protein